MLSTRPLEQTLPDPTPPRVAAIAGDDAPTQQLIERVMSLSRDNLSGMYLSRAGQFVHSMRQVGTGAPTPVGESRRYGAMVALGARYLEEHAQREIFHGESAAEFVARQLRDSDSIQNLGDLAVTLWAGRATGCWSEVAPVEARLLAMLDMTKSVPTVELAWSLSALVEGDGPVDGAAARRVRDRLMSAFNQRGALFAHLVGGGDRWYRRHIGCFADQVYPIQALARYHRGLGDEAGLEAARRCADRICALQGPQGQWWWHYDVRTGEVVEGYPVYSVHQDAMAPMALFDLIDAAPEGDPTFDFREPIRRGMLWMQHACEVGGSLIDEDAGVIWRKVGRAEPGKLTRSVRAGVSAVRPGVRTAFLERLAPAVRIDYECRPYHLGWVLMAWAARSDGEHPALGH